MTAATLWWVRHGPTHATGLVGWTDAPADLSDHAALARLDAYLPRAAAVISSDLVRARTTADAIAGTRSRLPDDPALREIHFGAWENRHVNELMAETPDALMAFWDRPGDSRPPGGEAWRDLEARVGAAADALASRGGDIIVVAHMGAILTQLGRALAIPPKATLAHRIDNLSVTRIDFDAGRWNAGPINHRP
ncbi:MAG: histidine phosphatase family protein [Rhodobacteraceae bacterium]|nr:histidine phosphatase family protein [Paracoccaceae bacterium]